MRKFKSKLANVKKLKRLLECYRYTIVYMYMYYLHLLKWAEDGDMAEKK